MPVPIDPRWLRSFLETYLNRGKYRRLIASRHFQGYITAVTAVPTNANNESGTQYLCSVQRVEESQADGNTYLCVTPGYKPVVGDLVELMWRDENVAYVLWPINGTTNSSAGAITSVQAGPSGTPISGAVEIDAGTDISVTESGQKITVAWNDPMSQKGQVLGYSGTDIAAVGPAALDGQELNSDSTKAGGLNFTTPPASVLVAYNYAVANTNPVPYQIGLGFSPNGRTFSRKLEPMIGPGSGFESIAVKDPCLLEVDGVLWCYYSGYNGSVFAIGVARSYDGGATWTKYGSNPIISAGTQGWEGVSVEFPTVLYDLSETDPTKRWKMWYSSETSSSGISVGIGYAYSSDGLSWTKSSANPVIAPTGTGWEQNGQFPGAIVKLGSTYYLFYNGFATAQSGHQAAIGAATFTNPEGTYTKNANNPLLSGDGKATTLTSLVSSGDTTINVTDSTVFPIGSAVHVFTLNGSARYITHVKSRPTTTSFVATDPAPISIPLTNGTVRSIAYNSIWIRSAIFDSGWTFGLVGFQPYGPDFATLLGETSVLGYADTDLSAIRIDYTAGMLIRLTPTESTDINISAENLSIIFPSDTWKRHWGSRAPASSVSSLTVPGGTPESGALTIQGDGKTAAVADSPAGTFTVSAIVYQPLVDPNTSPPSLIFDATGDVIMVPS